MANDRRVAALLEDGEDLMQRMARIDAGDRSLRLDVHEIRDWTRDVQRWAASTGTVLPEHQDLLRLLLPGPSIEEAARRLVNLLLEPLRSQAGARPESETAPTSSGRVFVSYLREDTH